MSRQSHTARLVREYKRAGFSVEIADHLKVFDDNGRLIAVHSKTPSSQAGMATAVREMQQIISGQRPLAVVASKPVSEPVMTAPSEPQQPRRPRREERRALAAEIERAEAEIAAKAKPVQFSGPLVVRRTEMTGQRPQQKPRRVRPREPYIPAPSDVPAIFGIKAGWQAVMVGGDCFACGTQTLTGCGFIGDGAWLIGKIMRALAVDEPRASMVYERLTDAERGWIWGGSHSLVLRLCPACAEAVGLEVDVLHPSKDVEVPCHVQNKIVRHQISREAAS